VATELFDELEESFRPDCVQRRVFFDVFGLENLWNVPPLTSRAHKHLHRAIHQVPDVDFAPTAAATIRSDEWRDLNPFRIGQVLDTTDDRDCISRHSPPSTSARQFGLLRLDLRKSCRSELFQRSS
jgi:hypothetical protein